MCWGWGKEERRSLISGSQSNYFHLFLICAEDPSGFHMKEMVATLQKGAPRECHLPKRHSSQSSPPVHHPTELMHLGRWERRFTASFEEKTAPGRKGKVWSSEGRTPPLRAVELQPSTALLMVCGALWPGKRSSRGCHMILHPD